MNDPSLLTIDFVRSALRQVRQNYASRDNKVLTDILSRAKQECVARGDSDGAKEVWCVERALAAQTHYVSAFFKMQRKEFYGAWCLLEQSEVTLHALKRHGAHLWVEYALDFIEQQTRRFQELFPYAMFFSIGAVVESRRCSICGAQITLRGSCDHEKGEIYDGEMCCHIIDQASLVEISAVPDPVNKYCVPFLSATDGSGAVDHYNYALVDYVVHGLRSPFHGWSVTKSERLVPHSEYAHVAPDGACPCGSTKTYGECCLLRDGVIVRHHEICYEVPPPGDLPPFKQNPEPVKGCLNNSPFGVEEHVDHRDRP